MMTSTAKYRAPTASTESLQVPREATRILFEVMEENGFRTDEETVRSRNRETRRAIIQGLSDQGMSLTEISEVMGLSYRTIAQDAKDFGIATATKPTLINDPKLVHGIRTLASQGRVTSEIAAALGCTGAQVRSIAKKHSIALTRLTPTHGLVSTYRSGCKCEPCVTVGKAYDAERRKVRLESEVKPEWVHGTLGGATNWGCSCERCVEAVRTHNKAAVALDAPIEKLFVRWTAEEDDVVVDRSLTAREAAIKLGRSVGAVNGRRKSLKGRQAALEHTLS